MLIIPFPRNIVRQLTRFSIAAMLARVERVEIETTLGVLDVVQGPSGSPLLCGSALTRDRDGDHGHDHRRVLSDESLRNEARRRPNTRPR
jgi:hypothetical protein